MVSPLNSLRPRCRGNKVCQSIVDAPDPVAEEIDRWDVVVIIRGGGAVSDLGGFDNYELAFNVAQFPLPVLTGIGHERDDTVVDYVANTRLKTPTAVAAFLIDRHAGELQLLDALVQRMRPRRRPPDEGLSGPLVVAYTPFECRPHAVCRQRAYAVVAFPKSPQCGHATARVGGKGETDQTSLGDGCRAGFPPHA